MSQRMKALESFRLRENRINPGDVFAVKPKDVEMLTRAKLAELTDDTEKKGEAGTLGLKASKARAARAAREAKPRARAQADSQGLAALTVLELRARAKKLGLVVPSGVNKAALLAKVRRAAAK